METLVGTGGHRGSHRRLIAHLECARFQAIDLTLLVLIKGHRLVDNLIFQRVVEDQCTIRESNRQNVRGLCLLSAAADRQGRVDHAHGSDFG